MPSRPSPTTLANWLFAPLALSAIALGLSIVLRAPGWMFGAALTLLLGVVFLWVFVSVLSPARADKTCPRCGAEAIRRLDPLSTRGITCSSCDFRDESASSFYLAEEADEPLEPILLGERRALR